MRISAGLAGLALTVLTALPAWADQTVVALQQLSTAGAEQPLGTVELADSKEGLVLRLRLSGLPPGPHGFHLHQNGSCAAAEKDGVTVPGLAAGGHYDPGATERHSGPRGEGHLGDLPMIEVDAAGSAVGELLAPRLNLAAVRGRALVIHAQADNYSDHPEPLGGGGARIACGVVP